MSVCQTQPDEQCLVCKKKVYSMEKTSIDGKSFHKTCFKCAHCHGVLKLGNFAALEGVFYCNAHLEQLFKAKGNYDEGFGRQEYKKKWSTANQNIITA